MPKVTFVNECITVEARAGQTVKQVAAERGLNLYRGLWADAGFPPCSSGWCGRCKIWVTPATPGAINAPTGWERLRPSIKGRVRLACQVALQGDVDVRTRPGGPAVARTTDWPADPRPSRWKDRWTQAGAASADEPDAAGDG